MDLSITYVAVHFSIVKIIRILILMIRPTICLLLLPKGGHDIINKSYSSNSNNDNASPAATSIPMIMISMNGSYETTNHRRV
jgi:hypothetical protein